MIGYSHKPPFVVSILNRKGGAGKTTLSTNIATKLHLNGSNVLLVDSDTQRSARDWHAAGDSKLKIIGLDRPTLEKDLKKAVTDFDWVIIDGVPQIKEMAVAAIKCSHLIIIPVQPSALDIWPTNDLVDLIKERWLETPNIPKAYYCMIRKIANTSISKEAYEVLKESELPVMESYTTQRVDYMGSVSRGKTVFDTKNTQAIEEITNIVNEMKEILT